MIIKQRGVFLKNARYMQTTKCVIIELDFGEMVKLGISDDLWDKELEVSIVPMDVMKELEAQIKTENDN